MQAALFLPTNPEVVKPKRTALFISHATPEDNDFVLWLGAKLNAMGYEVWADVLRLRGGDDWARRLENALRKDAVKMLLVCTPAGLDKQGVRNEIQIGSDVAKQLGDPAFIIPLRLQPFEAPFLVAQSQYVDFRMSWAKGLAELCELLREIGVPQQSRHGHGAWLTRHAEGAVKLQKRAEQLTSNWLPIRRHPSQIHYFEPPVGYDIERYANRESHSWPVVPHQGGVLAFASLEDQRYSTQSFQSRLVFTVQISDFLRDGWQSLGIDRVQAARIFADLGNQSFEAFCRARGLQGFMGSGNRLSWWGDIKIAPKTRVQFNWARANGSRLIVGQSGKRGVFWHYALQAQLRNYPLLHLRLATRLVFTENGLDPINEARRSHVLRRSFAKGWRNARWRDMLLAYLWWLAEGREELLLPVGEQLSIAVAVPPMQFDCPITANINSEAQDDEDDPDIPDVVSEEFSGDAGHEE
jgi:hypothetical protein